MRWISLALGLLCTMLAGAAIETYDFATDDLRARYQQLSGELRCPKCQNQNIADSNAPIAQDLRAQLHRQLHAGKSDTEIIDYMVARYGEFVLYRPRWSLETSLLWLAPILLLLLAAILVFTTVRRRPLLNSASDTLTDADRVRLKKLLEEDPHRD